MPAKGKIIETKREDGSIVGMEVSRQRRWQLRNKEKQNEIARRYYKTDKYRKIKREYMRRQSAEKKLKLENKL